MRLQAPCLPAAGLAFAVLAALRKRFLIAERVRPIVTLHVSAADVDFRISTLTPNYFDHEDGIKPTQVG